MKNQQIKLASYSPIISQLEATKVLLSANLAKLFPRTTFTIETVSEITTKKEQFNYIALKWDNDAILNLVKKLLEDLSLTKAENWVCPTMTITPKHMKLIEQKAKSMGMFGEMTCYGWNSDGAMYREEYSNAQLDLANERLYYDVDIVKFNFSHTFNVDCVQLEMAI